MTIKNISRRVATRMFFGIMFAVAIFAVLFSFGQSSGNGGYESAIAVAEKLGKVIDVKACSDEQGEYYIVYSEAYGGSEIVIADGEIFGVSRRRSCVAAELEQTDFYGNKLTLPIEYQDSEGVDNYFLSDFTRNIFLYDASTYNTPPYQSSDGTFNDGMAVTVYDTLIDTYEFYADEANIGVSWKGISGKNDDEIYNAKENGEVELVVYIHYGDKYENANCGYDRDSGYAVMYVGDGNRNGFLYNQGRARDVIGHEYQHAITDFATVDGSGLMYLNQSGAISEAVSDIFGMLIEGHELNDERFWGIGEDATTDGSILRSASKPTYGYAQHMSDMMPLCDIVHDHYASDCDNGNAHGNSTILTHAQYRMWQRMPQFFTKQNMGKLWFAALRHLGYRADFDDFVSAMISASEELGFPDDAKEVVRSCLYERGLIKDDTAHVLTFKNTNGYAIEKISVPNGGDVVAPVLPDIEQDNGDRLVFMGWDGATTAITESGELFPIYKEIPSHHTVTFRSGSNVIARVEVEHGAKAELPDAPFKPSDDVYKYSFAGWDQNVDCVLEDMDVNAIFDQIYVDYFATFFDGDDLIGQRKAHFGEELDSFAEPSRVGFDFVGWALDGEIVDSVTIDKNVALEAVWRVSAWVYFAIGGGLVVLIVLIVVPLAIRKRRV